MAKYRFAIRCSNCETTLRLNDEDLGTQRKCPKCDAILEVPAQVSAQQQAAAEEAKHEFSFLCKLCGTRLYGRPSQIGAGVECPDCQSINIVPAPAKPAEKQIPVSPGEDYELAPLEDRPPPSTVADVDAAESASEPPPDDVRFNCRYCNTLLYAMREQIGKRITCPDCNGQVTVPDRPAPKPKRSINLEDAPDIGVSPAAERPQEASNAESLMSSAREHVIEKERERPNPPKHPFGLDVYVFPFKPMVAAFGIVIFGMIALGTWLAFVALSSEGLGMIVGLVVWVFNILLTILTLVMASVLVTNIVTWAAMGYQKIVEWPHLDVLDWIRRGLFLFNALAISSAPGALLAYLLTDGVWRALLPLGSTFVLFPIIMLSMVSEETPFMPLSGFILTSLGRVTGSWIAFYTHAAILAGLIAIPVFVTLFYPNWAYVVVAIMVYAMLVYFRVLGRLAYVIDEGLAGYDDEKTDEDDGANGADTAVPEDQEEQGVEPPPIAGRGEMI